MTGPPLARIQEIYVDLGYWAIAISVQTPLPRRRLGGPAGERVFRPRRTTRIILTRRVVQFSTVLDFRMSASQKYEAVLRRARISGPWTFVSLNARLESTKEEGESLSATLEENPRNHTAGYDLSSKVNLRHKINFRATSGANLGHEVVTFPS